MLTEELSPLGIEHLPQRRGIGPAAPRERFCCRLARRLRKVSAMGHSPGPAGRVLTKALFAAFSRPCRRLVLTEVRTNAKIWSWISIRIQMFLKSGEISWVLGQAHCLSAH